MHQCIVENFLPYLSWSQSASEHPSGEEEVRGLGGVSSRSFQVNCEARKAPQRQLTGQGRSEWKVSSKLDTNALREQPVYFQILGDHHGYLHGWGSVWPCHWSMRRFTRLERNIWKKMSLFMHFLPQGLPRGWSCCSWSTFPSPSTWPIYFLLVPVGMSCP